MNTLILHNPTTSLKVKSNRIDYLTNAYLDLCCVKKHCHKYLISLNKKFKHEINLKIRHYRSGPDLTHGLTLTLTQ